MAAIFGHHWGHAEKWRIVWVREARLDSLLHWLINVPFAKSACCGSLRPFEPRVQQRQHFLGWVKKVSQGLMLFLLRWMVLLLSWMLRSHSLLWIVVPAAEEQMRR